MNCQILFSFPEIFSFQEETKLCVSLLAILIGKHVSIYTSKDILFHNPFGNLRILHHAVIAISREFHTS